MEWNLEEMEESCKDNNYAHLHYPCGRFLLAPQYPFCPNNTGAWVNGAVHDVDGDYVGAVLIGVFVPHPDDDVRPWVTAVMQT